MFRRIPAVTRAHNLVAACLRVWAYAKLRMSMLYFVYPSQTFNNVSRLKRQPFISAHLPYFALLSPANSTTSFIHSFIHSFIPNYLAYHHILCHMAPTVDWLLVLKRTVMIRCWIGVQIVCNLLSVYSLQEFMYSEPGLQFPRISSFGRGWATVVLHNWANDEGTRVLPKWH